MALFVDSLYGTVREVPFDGRRDAFLDEAYWLLGGEETAFIAITKTWGIVFGKGKHHCGFSIEVGDEHIFIANSGIFVGNMEGPVFNHFCSALREATGLDVEAACRRHLHLRFWTQKTPWKTEHRSAEYLANYMRK